MEDVIPPAPMPKTASNPIHEDRTAGGKKSLNTSTERLNKGSQMTSSSPEIPCDTEQARVETKPIKVQTILNKQLVKSPYLEEDKLLRSNQKSVTGRQYTHIGPGRKFVPRHQTPGNYEGQSPRRHLHEPVCSEMVASYRLKPESEQDTALRTGSQGMSMTHTLLSGPASHRAGFMPPLTTNIALSQNQTSFKSLGVSSVLDGSNF